MPLPSKREACVTIESHQQPEVVRFGKCGGQSLGMVDARTKRVLTGGMIALVREREPQSVVTLDCLHPIGLFPGPHPDQFFQKIDRFPVSSFRGLGMSDLAADLT